MTDSKSPAPAPTKTSPAAPKDTENAPTGVHTQNASSKPVKPEGEVQEVLDKNKKPNVEVAGVNSANNRAATADKATDTPDTDVGKGGTVATTGNQSAGKVAEPGTANTPNPPPTAAGLNDTPPAGGVETPSGGVRTSSQTSNTDENKPQPEPPDETPIPTDEELNALDAKHGYKPAIEAVTDNDDEVASMRKFVQMARELPESTPDGAVFGGFGTVRITYGDIRNIARVSQRSSND